MIYFVLTGNVRLIEQEQRGNARGSSFEKQVKDLMNAIWEASDSLQKIMTSRDLNDDHRYIKKFYQKKIGLKLPLPRRIGDQKAYLLFHNLERFLAGARAYCSSLLSTSLSDDP